MSCLPWVGLAFFTLFKCHSLDDHNEIFFSHESKKRSNWLCFRLFLFLFPLLKTASAFGDPHFFTFDGLNFTFKGQGEYTLVESDLTSLRVQGRTQEVHFPNGKLVREEAVMTNNSFWSWLICSSYHNAYVL